MHFQFEILYRKRCLIENFINQQDEYQAHNPDL